MRTVCSLRGLAYILVGCLAFSLAGCFGVSQKQPGYVLTVAMDGGGIMNPAVGQHNVGKNEVVQLEAAPKDLWEFSHWEGPVEDAAASATEVIVTESVTVTAHFTPLPGQQNLYSVGDVGFGMHFVRAAEFPMGTDDSEMGIVAEDFRIGETAVTYALWYEVKEWAEDRGYAFTAKAGSEGSTGDWGAAPTAARQEPVVRISWRDAIVWCNALSQYFGYLPVYTYLGDAVTDAAADTCDQAVQGPGSGFRLPTEEEWELAARYQGSDSSHGALEHPLGSGRYWTPGSYASGAEGPAFEPPATNYPAHVDPVAWYKDNSEEKTQPVAHADKRPNYLQLYDMSGNVYEWSFTARGDDRVVRGGSWQCTPRLQQIGYSELSFRTDLRDYLRGFRLVLVE